MNKLNQKGAIQFIIPILLIGGIAATVWLLTAGPLNFIPKALNLISSPISAPVPPTSEPPVVTKFTVTTDPGSLSVQFDVTCTPIPTQKIIAAIFSFGDATPDFTFNYSGNFGTSANLGTTHVYSKEGTYTVGVRCKDDNNSVSLPEIVNITLTAPSPTPTSTTNPTPSVAPSVAPTTEPTSTPTPVSTPIPSAAPTTPPNVGVGNPGGGSSGGGGNTPTQTVTITRTIKYFRYAESVAGLLSALWNSSYAQGVAVPYEFKDTTPGSKFIFVQFADGTDTNKQIIPINGQSYVTSPAIQLLPESTPIPTSVPTEQPAPAVNNPNTPTGPAPLSFDGPNCPISNPSNYDIGTLYTMCSVDQLARFDLKWLVDFPNNILIDIGERKGDLGGFLANFSGERLIGASPYSGSGFSLEILKQLPDWRKQGLPGYIQDQLK